MDPWFVWGDGLPGGVSDTCVTFTFSLLTSDGESDSSGYAGNSWYESRNPLLVVLFRESLALVTSVMYCAKNVHCIFYINVDYYVNFILYNIKYV